MNDRAPGVRVVQVEDLAWEPHVMGRSIRKVLDTDPTTDSYVHYRYAPPGGGNPKVRRLHLTISESFFFLNGCLPNWEFSSPEDTEGTVVDFVGGTFMDRLPYSVHGTGPDLASPTGSTFLMWTSGGGEFEADKQESIEIPFSGVMPTFDKPYTKPLIVDSRALAWEEHPRGEGWKWRVLSADASSTLTPRPVSIIYAPPGWETEDSLKPVDERAFLFVLGGSAQVSWQNQQADVNENTFVRWEPGDDLRLKRSSPVGCTMLVVGHDLAPG